jgi:hypothetical protein
MSRSVVTTSEDTPLVQAALPNIVTDRDIRREPRTERPVEAESEALLW